MSCLDSPRVTISNNIVTSDVHDTVIVKCRVCSNPQATQIDWLRHNQPIMDVNVLVQMQTTTDRHQCTESIMEIVVC